VSLKQLYTTNQAPGGRDTLPAVGHFVTQTVTNGRVYVGTQNSLEAYGLLQVVTVTGGNAQSATANTPLPAPIKVLVANPYNGQPDVGATVTFSDGCNQKVPLTCGSFNPTSAVTDSNGRAWTTYTVPRKAGTYTLTISGSGLGIATTTATAVPGPATQVVAYSGLNQTGPAGSPLPSPLAAQVQDALKNGISGVTVNFIANQGAVPNPSSALTGANGLAQTTLQLPTTVTAITVTPSSVGLKTANPFTEHSVAGAAANIAITSGNNQSAPAGTQLPQGLTVLVTDKYGNPVPGVDVDFNDGGAGGTYAYANPSITSNSGTVTQFYTLPPSPKTITINATATGVATPAVFTETAR
jgi:adhesin/invasin